MAVTSLWAVHADGKRGAGTVINQLTDYASNEEKTKDREEFMRQQENTSQLPATEADREETLQKVVHYVSDKNEGLQFVTGINCTPNHVVAEMLQTRARFAGRGNRILYHGYQSFAPGEVTPEQAHRIGVQLAENLWGDRFEVLVATHLDREHLHNHFVINAVSFSDGKKFRWDREYPRMQRASDELCQKEKLSVVADPNMEGGHHRGAVRAASEGRQTISSIAKEDLDCCIAEAESFPAFISLMEAKGYRLDFSGKYLKLIPPGRKAIRIDRRFGEDYSMDGIRSRIEQKSIYPSGLSYRTGISSPVPAPEKEVYEPYGRFKDPPVPAEKKAMLSAVGQLTGRSAPARFRRQPRGYQALYIRFLVRIGYPKKSSRRIARTHYLLREELTRLDRYIEESRLLIREGIETEQDLSRFRERETGWINDLKNEQMYLRNRIRRCIPEEEAGLRSRLAGINARLYTLRGDAKVLARVGERVVDMQRRIALAEQSAAGNGMDEKQQKNTKNSAIRSP